MLDPRVADLVERRQGAVQIGLQLVAQRVELDADPAGRDLVTVMATPS
jgi:hypothetical protein